MILTWDEHGHVLLLAQDGIEGGAGHTPQGPVSHHQCALHAEQTFSIFNVGLRGCWEIPRREAGFLEEK